MHRLKTLFDRFDFSCFVLFRFVSIVCGLSFLTPAEAAAAVQWRFVEQSEEWVVLRVEPVVAGDDASTYSAAWRRSALLAVPPGGNVTCETDGYEQFLTLAPPEPFREVALVCLTLSQEADAAASREFVFRISEPALAADGPATPRKPARADPSPENRFGFDPLIDALAINRPVPARYRRPGYDAPAPGLSRGAAAFPSDYDGAVEIDTPTTTAAWMSVRVGDVMDAVGAAGAGAALESLRFWSEGKPLEVTWTSGPLTRESIAVFQAPASALPFFEGSRIYITFPKDFTAETQRRRESQRIFNTESQKLHRKSKAFDDSEKIRKDSEFLRIEASAMRYRRRADLDTRPLAADILVVAAAELIPALAPWEALRREQGYRVEIASVDAVYQCFGAGLPRPSAIRAFAAHAYANAVPPAPAYLMLVGDASSNYTDPATTLVLNQVPTWHNGQPSPVDPSTGAVPATDDAFVRFLGRGILPAMMVGRLTVRTPEEAAAVVTKIIDYETHPERGPWRAQSLWMVDPGYDHLFEPDTIAPPAGLVPRILRVTDYPWMDHYALPDIKISPEANRSAIAQLGRGAAVMRYAGHGGVTLLSRQKLFYHTDIPQLGNGRRLPFCIQISCNTGCFDYPEAAYSASIAERMLREPTGGAIGVFAASRFLLGDEYALQRGLDSALNGRMVQTLGQITTEAKIRLLAAQRMRRGVFADSYNLLGDPTTVFAPPSGRIGVTFVSATPPGPALPGPIQILVQASFEDDAPTSMNVAFSLIDDKGQTLDFKQTRAAKARPCLARLEAPAHFTGERLFVSVYGTDSASTWEGAGRLTMPVAPLRLPEAQRTDAARVTFFPKSLNFKAMGEQFVDGETIFFDVYVVNEGARASDGFRVGLVHRHPESEAGKEVDSVWMDGLAPGALRPVRLRYDDCHTTGAQRFRLTLDGADVIQPVPGGEFTLNILPKPDLAVAPEGLRAEWSEDGRLRAKATISNQGGASTLPTTAQFYLGESMPRPVGAPIRVAPIAAGETLGIGPVDIPLPPESVYPLTLWIRLDINQDHTEQDEDNNTARLTVQRPE